MIRRYFDRKGKWFNYVHWILLWNVIQREIVTNPLLYHIYWISNTCTNTERVLKMSRYRYNIVIILISGQAWYCTTIFCQYQYCSVSIQNDTALYRYRTILLCIDTERYCSVSILLCIDTALYRYRTILLCIDTERFCSLSIALCYDLFTTEECYVIWIGYYFIVPNTQIKTDSFMFLLISTLAPKWCTKKLFSFLTVPRIKLLSY